MSQVVIAGDVSGTVTLQAPSAAGTTVLTLPSTSGYVQAPTTVGTSGQLLTSAGGGAPTWSNAPSSAMTLISTQTASNSASLVWTGLSGYDKYLVIAENLLPVSPSGKNLITLGYGATPTYITSGYYFNYIAVNYPTGAGGGVFGGATSETAIYFQYGAMTANTNQYQATCLIVGCSSGINKGYFVDAGWDDLSSPGNELYKKIGTLVNTNAITAIKVTNDSGNLGTGKVSLYGISS
jgi:hypothetical protein